jgi:hypothetical protein
MSEPQLKGPDNAVREPSQDNMFPKAQPTKKPELHSQATENARCLTERPEDSSEHLFECPKTSRWPANEQGQASILPGETGEERRGYIVNKINEANTRPRSPEPHVALMPQGLLLASTPHPHRSPDALAIPSSAHQAQSPAVIPMQATPICQPSDELPLSAETVSRRCGLTVTARKQYESAKTPSRGVKEVYLARALAYIQKCLSKRALMLDTFSPRMLRSPPSRAIKMRAEQRYTDNISRGTRNGTEDTPCYVMMGSVLSNLSLAHPARASRYHKLSTKYKHLIGGHCGHGLSQVSVSADSTNNGLTPGKVNNKPSLLLVKIWEGEESLLIEAVEEFGHDERHGQEATSKEMENT